MMEKDDNLEKLFEGFASDLEPDDVFLSRLEKRLEVVDLLKAHELQQKRQLRYCIIGALVLGVVLGALLMWSTLNIPMDVMNLNLVWSIGTLKVGSLLRFALILAAAGAIFYFVLRMALDKLRGQLF